jgi:two-component system sensor histidine kinase KdpD
MNQTKQPTEHILACLSSSPSNAKIVRTAATMAKAFGGTFTALYVRTPDANQMGKEDRQRLQQHIRMAEQAGADISTIYGDDIPQQIAEFARISGVTKIVLGRSSIHRRHFWSGPSLTEKLTLTAPNLDIYIIPDASAENGYGSGRKLFIRTLLPSVRDLLITVGIWPASRSSAFYFCSWTLHGTTLLCSICWACYLRHCLPAVTPAAYWDLLPVWHYIISS